MDEWEIIDVLVIVFTQHKILLIKTSSIYMIWYTQKRNTSYLNINHNFWYICKYNILIRYHMHMDE